MTDQISGSLGTLVLAGSAVLGIVIAGSAVIGTNLATQARLEDAAFIGHAEQSPPQLISGRDARARLHLTVALSLVAPFAPFGVAAIALALTGSAPLALVGAELTFLAALVLMRRAHRMFVARLDQEAQAGYSSFERTPFGEPVAGLWTGIRSANPRPPAQPPVWAHPPIDPAIRDALDSYLELSPPLTTVSVPDTSPALLPGRAALVWLNWGWRLVDAAWLSWFVVFIPAVGLPDGDLRTAVIAAGAALFVIGGPAGMILGFVGRDRAYKERAAGYTTLRGGEDSMVVMGNTWVLDAWQTFGTDHLWHLDPATGRVIRPPIDPTWALRDRRVHRSIGRYFAWAPRK